VAGAGEAGARGLGVLGQAEVGQVGVLLALVGDQHVGGLDVAVDEPAAVRGVERAPDLPDDADGALGVQPVRRLDERAHVGALDVAHREVEHALRLAGLEDRDDVGMVDRGGELRLGLEAVAEVDVVGQLGRDHLQCDCAAEAELRGAVHDAHPALACDPVDAVAAEDGAGVHEWGHAPYDDRPGVVFPFGRSGARVRTSLPWKRCRW
jgi:hypothetical protein